MSLYRDTGVVLRTYKLGEADRIVVLLTADHGKVRAVAKGVRKTKSRFGGRLEPLNHVSLLLYEGRELDIVSQAETLDSLGAAARRPRPPDAGPGAAGGRRPGGPGARAGAAALPDARRRAAHAGGAGRHRSSCRPSTGSCWPLEGVRPELDACVRCGDDRADSSPSTWTRAACCAAPAGGARPLSPDALRLIRLVLGGDLDDALAEPPSPATDEVAALATAALEHLLERRLRAVAMFERSSLASSAAAPGSPGSGAQTPRGAVGDWAD